MSDILELIDGAIAGREDEPMSDILTTELEDCEVLFAGHGCERPRGHPSEESLDSHVCECGVRASDFALVFGSDAVRLGLSRHPADTLTIRRQNLTTT